MWLRWIVSNYVRQAAERKISDLASEKLNLRPGEQSDTLPADPDQPEQEEVDGETLEESSLPARSEFDLAVLFALKIESGGLVDKLDEMIYTRCASYIEHAGLLNDRPVIVADTGVGTKSATKAAQDVIALVKPKWLVSAGFCGALKPHLRKGQILMANEIVDLHGNHVSVGFKMDPEVAERTPHLEVGRLLTVDELVRSSDEKKRLGEEHDAVACDMETAAIAKVCKEAGIGFLSVRIVSDAVDQDLPQEIIPLMQQKTLAAKLGAATGALFKRPSTVKDLWKLREEAIKQSDRLAGFLSGVIDQLPT